MKRDRTDAALMSMLGLLAIAGILYSATGGEWFSVWLLALVLIVAVLIIGPVFVWHRRCTRRAVLPAFIAPMVCLSIIVSVAATQWPLRATYALSRDALDAVAE